MSCVAPKRTASPTASPRWRSASSAFATPSICADYFPEVRRGKTEENKMDYREEFLVKPGKRFKIGKADPNFFDGKLKKQAAERVVENNRLRVAEGHMRLYAE